MAHQRQESDEGALWAPAPTPVRERAAPVARPDDAPPATLREACRASLSLVADLCELLGDGGAAAAPWSTEDCVCRMCREAKTRGRRLANVLAFLDFSSPLWARALPPACGGAGLLALPGAHRQRLFDHMVAMTASHGRWLPELVLESHASPAAAPFARLCEMFRASPAWGARGKPGDVGWKARYTGAAFVGAEGLPGPFRQSVTDVCADLRGELAHVAGAPPPLLVPSPNRVNQTGLDRHTMVLNPAASSAASLAQCYALGQLLGVAVRSRNTLDVDLADSVWKRLLHYRVGAADLAVGDYTAWSALRFADPRDGHPFTRAEFDEFLGDTLRFTCRLSDGRTEVPLRAGGAAMRVRYEERRAYAAAAVRARMGDESSAQLERVRLGLWSVVPRAALSLLTWEELKTRVCGDGRLDLERLRRSTVYAPAQYTDESAMVRYFWRALASFDDDDRARFLQFAWARKRLPPSSEQGASWRMKVNFVVGVAAGALPTAETCFFNVNIPLYDSYETLRSKLRQAIELCSSITS